MSKRKIFIFVLSLVALLCFFLILSSGIRPAKTEAQLYKEKYGLPLIPTNPPEIEDEHGCLIQAGYIWCELKQKCLRPYEEICEVPK